jgi:hypothetical protein
MKTTQTKHVHPSSPFWGRGRGINRYATTAISRKKKGLTKKEMTAVA